MISAIMAYGISGRTHTHSVSYKVLNDKSLEFINEYFPDRGISSVFSTRGRYSVVLKGSLVLEFLVTGDWVRVNGNGKAIPTTNFIDTNIMNSLNRTYGNVSILSISKLNSGKYRARLTNGVEVTLDSNANIIKERNI